ncbi:hypothetical protein ABEB36_006059 [Hypothenemus hampei]|uniref:Uncharacterized protein n=1 Tax=Hypothenemus hampei TaxID=57062 RepID=A0ABD1F0C9_HYPHA
MTSSQLVRSSKLESITRNLKEGSKVISAVRETAKQSNKFPSGLFRKLKPHLSEWHKEMKHVVAVIYMGKGGEKDKLYCNY